MGIQGDIIDNSWIPGGGTWVFFGWVCVAPGTPNWHPVLGKISPKIDTPL